MSLKSRKIEYIAASNKVYLRCETYLTSLIESNGFIDINPAIGPNARITNIKEVSIIPVN